MSGIEVVGLIAAIIEITSAIANVYDAIKDIKSLPSAFREVNNRLPIVKSILESAKTNAEDAPDDDPQKLKTLLDSCEDKAKKLLKIFKELSNLEGKSPTSVYKKLALTHGGKEGRVETLMGGIMMDIQSLTSYRVFQTATKDQVEALKKAIEELAQVEPSLPDSAFEERAGSFNHYGQGDMFNHTGPGKQINHGSSFEAARDINLSMSPEFLKLLQGAKNSKAP